MAETHGPGDGEVLLRRSFLLAIGLVTAACGDGETVSDDPFCQAVLPRVAAFLEESRRANPTPDDPRYGGTVVVGNYGEISDGMNSATSADYTSTQHQQFVNLMTLIRYDENVTPQPYLAESWEVAPDGRSITFRLRQDVYWHDGERTDAHDVAFTWDVVTDPLTAFPNAAFWNHYVKGPEGIEVIDDFSVRLHLEPHAEFLDAIRHVAILPEHLLGDVPHDRFREHPFGTQCPVGNGPFVFESHLPQQRWTFVANPVFPQALGGRPFVDRYVYRNIPEQTTLLTELLTGNVDIYVAPSPDHAEQILADPDLELIAYTSRQYNMVIWNARRPQLADPRVRRALTLATNREQIVEAILQGYGVIAHTGVPPFHWAYDPEGLPVLPYDPAAARALLDEAGWRDRDGDGVREAADGTRLEITIKYNPNQLRQQTAEVMQSQLAEIGVAAQPQSVEYTTLLRQINDPAGRDFDGVLLGWVTEFKVDDLDLFHSERIGQPYAWSGTRNAEMDHLMEALNLTVDREAARPLWEQYQEALIEEQPYTYLYFPERLGGVNRRLRDVVMDARGDWVNIKDWYLDPASR
jgi:peptide/nickel transport system substrate-binding protein